MPNHAAALLAPCLPARALAAQAQAATSGRIAEAFSEIARFGIMQETDQRPTQR